MQRFVVFTQKILHFRTDLRIYFGVTPMLPSWLGVAGTPSGVPPP
jgi:hypothetical protein